MPAIRQRVVWTLGDTIASLLPIRRFRSVDLPELEGPNSAVKPHAVLAWFALENSLEPAEEGEGEGVGGDAEGLEARQR